MKVRVRRASVAMGDDTLAPHEKWIDLPADCTHERLVKATSRNYLASIIGGKATWVAWLSDDPDTLQCPIAVLAHQWRSPRVLSPDARRAPGEDYVYFTYLAQRDPLDILDRVLTGRPMID